MRAWPRVHERLLKLSLLLLFITVAYWRKNPMEERSLRDLFGAAYDDYRRHTWALIPGLF